MKYPCKLEEVGALKAVSAKLQQFIVPPVTTNSHPGRHDSEEHRRRKQMPSEGSSAEDSTCDRTRTTCSEPLECCKMIQDACASITAGT